MRSALWRAGCRFRKNVEGLPGRPDIVFSKPRVVVFCDGDFWHGRDWPERQERLRRGHNAAYWIAKIDRNMARDLLNTEDLRAAGWRVLRFWERDIVANTKSITNQVLQAIGPPRR